MKNKTKLEHTEETCSKHKGPRNHLHLAAQRWMFHHGRDEINTLLLSSYKCCYVSKRERPRGTTVTPSTYGLHCVVSGIVLSLQSWYFCAKSVTCGLPPQDKALSMRHRKRRWHHVVHTNSQTSRSFPPLVGEKKSRLMLRIQFIVSQSWGIIIVLILAHALRLTLICSMIPLLNVTKWTLCNDGPGKYPYASKADCNIEIMFLIVCWTQNKTYFRYN